MVCTFVRVVVTYVIYRSLSAYKWIFLFCTAYKCAVRTLRVQQICTNLYGVKLMSNRNLTRIRTNVQLLFPLY